MLENFELFLELSGAALDICWLCTGEGEVQQDGAFPVPDAADGGKVNVQDEEEDAAQEAGDSHCDTVVAGISVVVKDAEQTLAANVDVALVDDAAEHHYGENLRAESGQRLDYLTARRE